jgi:hypothetical protein
MQTTNLTGSKTMFNDINTISELDAAYELFISFEISEEAYETINESYFAAYSIIEQTS